MSALVFSLTACAYVLHSAFEVVSILKSLSYAEDAGGGASSDEAVGGPLAFGPAHFLGSDVATSLGQSKVLQTSDPSIPLSKLHSPSVLSAHAENVCPDTGVLQHPEGLVQGRVEGRSRSQRGLLPEVFRNGVGRIFENR